MGKYSIKLAGMSVPDATYVAWKSDHLTKQGQTGAKGWGTVTVPWTPPYEKWWEMMPTVAVEVSRDGGNRWLLHLTGEIEVSPNPWRPASA